MGNTQNSSPDFERRLKPQTVLFKGGKQLGEKKTAPDELKERAPFPLLRLPDDLLLAVAAKLELTQRRHLMQSCTQFRQVLYGKRSKHLDCRLPAVYCLSQLRETKENELRLRVKAGCTAKGASNIWIDEVFPLKSAVTESLADSIDHLANNFTMKKFYLILRRLAIEETSFTASLLEEVSKNFELVIGIHPHFTPQGWHLRQLASLLLDCPHSITLIPDDYDRKPHDLFPQVIQRLRTSVEETVVEEATERGISVMYENSTPSFKFHMDVIENYKILTVFRRKVEDVRWMPIE